MPSLTDAYYLLYRRGDQTSYKVSHNNISNVAEPGDWVFCNISEGVSRKVEYDDWDSIPDNARLLANTIDNNVVSSHYVTGANFKTALQPSPSGPFTVGFEVTPTSKIRGDIDLMANDKFGNSNWGGGQGDGTLITCFLYSDGTKVRWKAGDTFNFYTKTNDSATAILNAGGQLGDIQPNSWNKTGDQWKTVYTINVDAEYVQFNIEGGQLKIFGTRINVEDAGADGTPGSLPGYTNSRLVNTVKRVRNKIRTVLSENTVDTQEIEVEDIDESHE